MQEGSNKSDFVNHGVQRVLLPRGSLDCGERGAQISRHLNDSSPRYQATGQMDA